MEPLAARYRAGFERILQTLGLYEGFVLLPVEAPGREVVEALCRYLEGASFDCELVAPSGEGWRDVAARLLAAGTPSDPGRQRVLVLYGELPISEALDVGFRLLNQQRDSLVAELGCPLLWCGSAEFLEASWERMPDFWSIRALKQKLVPAGGVAEAPVLGTWRLGGEGEGEDLEELWELWNAARDQGDPIGVLRLGVRLAGELYDRSELEDAGRIGRESLDRSAHTIGIDAARLQLLILLSAIDHRLANFETSAGWLQSADELAARLDTTARVQVLFTAGELADMSGNYQLAEEKFRRALEVSEEDVPSSLVARVTGSLAEVLTQTGRIAEAKALLRNALSLASSGMDRRNGAFLLFQGGLVAFAADDLVSARRFWDAALALNEQLKDREGVAACRLHLALAALQAGSLDRTRHEAAAVLELSAQSGLEEEEGAALSLLARVAILEGRLPEAKKHLEDAVVSYGKVRYAGADATRKVILETLEWAHANGDVAAVEMINEIARHL